MALLEYGIEVEKVTMITREIVIESKNGLHIRPAAQFVNEAKRFESTVEIKCDGKSANAKSLFKLQLLGLKKGSTIEICAEGADAQKAIDHLADFLSTLT